jgi:hypothetical protein
MKTGAIMTTPTPPRDLRFNDDAGIAGTIHECDPAAVERLRALMAQQRPPRWQEAARRQYNGDRIVSHLRQAAQAHAAKVRVVLSDEQMTDIDQRRADGESWAGLARAYGITQTTLMAAYARQTAAKRQEQPQ